MNRRRLLHLGALAAGGPFLAPCATAPSSTSSGSEVLGGAVPRRATRSDREAAARALIIGAGVSGLAAARTLVDRHGMGAAGQVVVVEGRGRAGLT